MKIKVAEAYKGDVGRMIARLDTETMEKLNVKAGDIILIKGDKEAPAIVMRSRPEDAGLGYMRIDGILRRNAGTSLGEEVEIRKVEPKPARSVTLAPMEDVQLTGDVAGFFLSRLRDKPVLKGNVLSFSIFGNILHFKVTSTNPQGVVIVNNDTAIKIGKYSETAEKIPDVRYEDIGGLDEAIKKIREMVELPMKHPEIFKRVGISPPKGILLHGPPGTGKTLLAKAVANESGANFYIINGPEIMNKYYGESEKNLREIFKEAEENAPSVIFIDEIDAIAPKREEVTGEVERRVVSQLLTLMDGLKGRGQVVVIAATNRPNSIDPALRRPGRFDREIEIGIPDTKARKEILQIHTRGMPLADEVNLDEIAESTHGYTGADLAALCKEAAMKAIRRVLPEIEKLDEKLSPEFLEKIVVTKQDFVDALAEIEPSGMREIIVEVPNVRWDDIGGLDDVKQELREMVEWPLKHPEAFRRIGIDPPKGILLYGPPGTGKTLLAKAVATESEANFTAIKGPEIFSKWVGESEKAIREVFRKARQMAPCIILFDEIDSIAPRRGAHGTHAVESVVNQLLAELDGIEKLEKVFVIATTNRPDMIDPALLRPGRIDRMVYVPMPDEKMRLEILKVHTRNMPLAKDVDLKELAKKTEGYSGADIAAIVREAGLQALREDINAKKVGKKHFEKALKRIKPSVSKSEIERIRKVAEEMGSH